MFTKAHLRWLSDTIEAIRRADSIEGLARSISEACDSMFHPVACGVEELAPSRGRLGYKIHHVLIHQRLPEGFAACIHDHPLGTRAGGIPGVIRLRNIVSQRLWYSTDHYNGVARPLSIVDQLVVPIQLTPAFIGLTAYRDHRFTEVEERLAQYVRSHLQQRWARLSTCIPESDAVPFTVSTECAQRFPGGALTSVHQQLFRDYFPTWRGGDRIPEPLSSWLKTFEDTYKSRANHGMPPVFTVPGSGGKLLIRAHPNVAGRNHRLVLTEWTAGTPELRLSPVNRLTLRERQVLRSLSTGQRDAEVATHLGCSTRTVSKHVENILAKLGVESRAAAANMDLEMK